MENRAASETLSCFLAKFLARGKSDYTLAARCPLIFGIDFSLFTFSGIEGSGEGEQKIRHRWEREGDHVSVSESNQDCGKMAITKKCGRRHYVCSDRPLASTCSNEGNVGSISHFPPPLEFISPLSPLPLCQIVIFTVFLKRILVTNDLALLLLRLRLRSAAKRKLGYVIVMAGVAVVGICIALCRHFNFSFQEPRTVKPLKTAAFPMPRIL